MRKEKFSYLILVFEIVAIVYLHSEKTAPEPVFTNNSSLEKNAGKKSFFDAPALPFLIQQTNHSAGLARQPYFHPTFPAK